MCLRVLLVSVAILSSTVGNPVSFIKKCHIDDSKCIKEVTAEAIPDFALGIPELSIKSLDPVTFKKLDASSPSLQFILKDVSFKGLKDCKPKKVLRDVATNKITIKLSCDIEGDGQYEMKGRLLILGIEGKGNIHIKLRKMLIGAELEMGRKMGSDGKMYWDVKNWKHSYELKDKADISFENLFPANELLGRAARELVASNGNDIVKEVGAPIIKVVAKEIVDTVNDFFHKVPVEDLILN